MKSLDLNFDYICSSDKLPCNRFSFELGVGDCVSFDVKGRRIFLCARYVAPAGLSVPKQLTVEELESGSFSLREV